jgi:signal transduction histidine kinase
LRRSSFPNRIAAMLMSPDQRQAVWLTVGTWALAVLLYLVPHHVLQLQGGATAYIVVGVINTCAAGALVSFLLPAVARLFRHRGTLARTAGMAGSVFLASVLLTLYDLTSDAVLDSWFAPDQQAIGAFEQAALNLVSVVWPFALLAAAYTILESQKLARERDGELATARQQTSRAEASATAAQLAALRYQLNPHFLFNTLNAISSLIVTERAADAEIMTGKLSGFLRASLEADPASEVTLDEELETIQSYLEIEAVRFGERLAIAFDCPAPLLAAMVPSFLLQPIVENAVKYAVAPSRRPVTVTIRASTDGGLLCIAIEDDGRQAFGALPKGGTGLGLANVRQRLNAFYGAAGTIDAVATERGFKVDLKLPYRTFTCVSQTAA